MRTSVNPEIVAICDLDMNRASMLAAILGDIPVVETLDAGTAGSTLVVGSL